MIKGLKNIGDYVGCSPSTVLRRHDAWQKHGDPSLSLPMVPMATGKGRGICWQTDSALLQLWLRNLAQHSARERLNRKKKAPRGRSASMGGKDRKKLQGAQG
jgi:hypothetical protein